MAVTPFLSERRCKLQLAPCWIKEERRLVLFRFFWNNGTPGDGRGYSAKVSFSICWDWKDAYIGVRVIPELWGFIARILPLPFVGLRVHLKRAYGGRLF